jgi:hypothetical protein
VPWVQLIWYAHYQGKLPHVENLGGSFWWRDVLKLVDNFRGVAAVTMGKGDTFIFWSDTWLMDNDSRPMKDRFPRLHSYALNENMSAAQVYSSTNMFDLFYLPLSNQAHQDFLLLQEWMMDNRPTAEDDVWTYCWGGQYKAAKFYKHIHSHIQVLGVYKWLWKSSCIMRTKVFAWLLLSDMFNTRDMLQRRNWRVTGDTHYELCPL